MDLHKGDSALIMEECLKQKLTLQQMAYVLATAYWETNRTMKPVREAYWLPDQWRQDNLRYYPWYGRGYVQLTWERNYMHASRKVGVDLIADPDLAMRPYVAVPILVTGMMEGWFTGLSLPDYVRKGTVDYNGARRVVNGMDKSFEIAELARQYEATLKKAKNLNTVKTVGPPAALVGIGTAIAAVFAALIKFFGG